jgi:hypothetical protein
MLTVTLKNKNKEIIYKNEEILNFSMFYNKCIFDLNKENIILDNKLLMSYINKKIDMILVNKTINEITNRSFILLSFGIDYNKNQFFIDTKIPRSDNDIN